MFTSCSERQGIRKKREKLQLLGCNEPLMPRLERELHIVRVLRIVELRMVKLLRIVELRIEELSNEEVGQRIGSELAVQHGQLSLQ